MATPHYRRAGCMRAYDYTHDLLREVAYSELSPVRRRSLHRRVARALGRTLCAGSRGSSGWLAAHYEAGGYGGTGHSLLPEPRPWRKQRFADAEAADQIRRALRLCRDFPETAKRDKRGNRTACDAGAITGHYAWLQHPRGRRDLRARAACCRDDQATETIYSRSSAEHGSSILCAADWKNRGGLGRTASTEARRERASRVEMAGRFLLGTTSFIWDSSRHRASSIEQALRAQSVSDCDPALALFAGPDVDVFCRAYMLASAMAIGICRRELRYNGEQAIALARELSHPFSLAIALDYAAMLSVFRRRANSRCTRAEESCCALPQARTFAYYLAWADMLAGWATAVGGDRYDRVDTSSRRP